MASLRTYQSNFTGGELSPEMAVRTDVSKYQSGAKLIRNFTIRPQGGLRFRPGFELVGEIGDSADEGWLGAFVISEAESYVLEFGENTLRFIRDGAYILKESREVDITSVTAADPAVVTATGHDFVDGERVFLSAMAGAPDLSENFYTVAAAATNTFQLVDRWGQPVNRAGLSAGIRGLAAPVYEIATPYTCLCASRLNYTQDQDVLLIFSHTVEVHRLVRIAPDNWTLTPETFAPVIAAPATVTATVDTGSGSETYSYKVSAIDEETGEESLPSTAATVDNDLSVAGAKNKIEWTAVTGAARYVVYKEDNGIYGFIGGTEGLELIDENITADVADTPQRLRDPFTGSGNYPSRGTFFEQRLWLANTLNNPNGVWASQTGRPRNLNVSSPLKDDDAITFRVRALKSTEIMALVPTDNLIMLTGMGEWLIRGPQIEEVLTPSNPVLRQRAFRGSASFPPPLPVGDLVLHVQRGGDAIRDFRLQREVPSTELSLLARHLFDGRVVKDWAYAQMPDSIVWVALQDGTLLSMTYMLEHEVWGWTRHRLGGNGAVESLTVVPEGRRDVLYAVVRRNINGVQKRYVERLSEGTDYFPDWFLATGLAVLSGRWSDAARFWNAPEGYTGVIPPPFDHFHVDAGLRYEGLAANVLYGLDHLEGETVVALADGNVIRDLVVENGKVTLPDPASEVSIGLGYTGRIETLPLDLGPLRDVGSIVARHKVSANIILRVENARGLFVGQGRGFTLYEHKQRQLEPLGTAIEPFTGDIEITPESDWTQEGTLIIEQRDPLPAHILAVLADWEFGE